MRACKSACTFHVREQNTRLPREEEKKRSLIPHIGLTFMVISRVTFRYGYPVFPRMIAMSVACGMKM